MSASRTTGGAKALASESTPASYEAALEELERLLADMEGQQLPLDRLLESYRRGAELLEFCKLRLQTVEQQVKVLEGEGLKSWEDS